jgi:hypothetical protein
MERMRDVLRGNLGRSLHAIQEGDRLAMAWEVACGHAMASHAKVVGYHEGLVRIEVENAVWMRQMIALRSVLEREMAKIAEMPVRGIEFELEKEA